MDGGEEDALPLILIAEKVRDVGLESFEASVRFLSQGLIAIGLIERHDGLHLIEKRIHRHLIIRLVSQYLQLCVPILLKQFQERRKVKMLRLFEAFEQIQDACAN